MSVELISIDLPKGGVDEFIELVTAYYNKEEANYHVTEDDQLWLGGGWDARSVAGIFYETISPEQVKKIASLLEAKYPYYPARERYHKLELYFWQVCAKHGVAVHNSF